MDKKYLILLAWLKKTDLNAKSTEIEGEILGITGLATNSPLTAVKNKIADVSSLVKKTDYNTKLVKLTKSLMIIIIANTLLLQNLIL